MISAAEALALPAAQLTPEEIEAVDKLDAAMDEHIRGHMKHNGIDAVFKSDETRGTVIAEFRQRLLAAGFEPKVELVVEQHNLNRAISRAVGFRVMAMFPSDESYRAAARNSLQ